MAVSAYHFCFARSLEQQPTPLYVFQVVKPSTDTLMNEMQRHFSRKVCLLFRKNPTISNVWFYRLIESAMQVYFPQTSSFDTVFCRKKAADWDLKRKNWGAFSKTIKSIYSNDSDNSATNDNLSVSDSQFLEPNTVLGSRDASYRPKKGDWKIDWRNVAGGCGQIFKRYEFIKTVNLYKNQYCTHFLAGTFYESSNERIGIENVVVLGRFRK